jgi:hypothetical protein
MRIDMNTEENIQNRKCPGFPAISSFLEKRIRNSSDVIRGSFMSSPIMSWNFTKTKYKALFPGPTGSASWFVAFFKAVENINRGS